MSTPPFDRRDPLDRDREPRDPQRGRHADPQKAAARLAYSNRQLRRRLAALERAASGETRLPPEPSPKGYADGPDRTD